MMDEDKRAEAHERKFIGIDANIDLPVNRPVSQLGPGELFGEDDLSHVSAAFCHRCHAGAVRDGGNVTRNSRHASSALDRCRTRRRPRQKLRFLRSRALRSRQTWRKNIVSARSKRICVVFRCSDRSVTIYRLSEREGRTSLLQPKRHHLQRRRGRRCLLPDSIWHGPRFSDDARWRNGAHLSESR
jgi:hypothetical protein